MLPQAPQAMGERLQPWRAHCWRPKTCATRSVFLDIIRPKTIRVPVALPKDFFISETRTILVHSRTRETRTIRMPDLLNVVILSLHVFLAMQLRWTPEHLSCIPRVSAEDRCVSNYLLLDDTAITNTARTWTNQQRNTAAIFVIDSSNHQVPSMQFENITFYTSLNLHICRAQP